MILSTLVTSQLHFEMCAGLYGHPVFPAKPLQKTDNFHRLAAWRPSCQPWSVNSI